MIRLQSPEDINALRQMLQQGIISNDDLNQMEVGGGFVATRPQSQSMAPNRKMRVVGYGNGQATDLGEEDMRATPIDYTRAGVDIPGVGKGHYSRDGKFAYVQGPEGMTKVVLGYDAEASDRRNDMQMKREAARAQIDQTRAQTDTLRAKPMAPPVFNAELGKWVYAPDAQNPQGRAVAPLDEQGQPLMGGGKVPVAVADKITTNLKSTKVIDEALANLKTEAGQNATGWKGYLMSLPGGKTALNQYVDPEGADTRAAVADFGSLQVKDRSGATVTMAEEPRLAPWIPMVTDDTATAQKKLTRLKAILESDVQNELQFFPQAAKHVDAIRRGNTQQAPTSGPVRVSGDREYNALPSGAEYIGPDGVTRKKR